MKAAMKRLFLSLLIIPTLWLGGVPTAGYHGLGPAAAIAQTAGPIDVKTFGAKGDGITDDTTAINNAIAYVAARGGGDVVSYSPHLITTPILMGSGVNLRINNTLTASGMSAPGATEIDHSAILFQGTSVLTSALTVSGVTSDLSVTVANSAGIATGDTIVVEDDSNFGRGAQAGSNSHLARVMNVAGNVLTINNPLPTAFPAASSLARKVTLLENATAVVKTIAGAPYQGVTFQWARHAAVRDTEVNPVGKNAIYFHRAFGNLATNIIARNPTSVVSPYGYGALFDFGASDNTLKDSYFEGIREISVAENARRNHITSNRIIAAVDSALNTHGLAAMDTLFENNTIINSAQYGISIGQTAASGTAVDIRTVARGNTFINSVGWSIREVQFSPGTSIASDTIIENNVIRFGATDAIYIGGAGVATDFTNTVVRNNKIISPGGNGIFLDGVSVNGAVVENNTVNSSTTAGIILNGTGDNIVVKGNTITSAGTYGIRNFAEGPRILLGGNKVISATTANYLNVGMQAPLSGAWKTGDVMPNDGNPSAGAYIGWVCVTGGSPGTWKAFGAILP